MCAHIALKARTRSFLSTQGLKLQVEDSVYTVPWIQTINGNTSYWSETTREQWLGWRWNHWHLRTLRLWTPVYQHICVKAGPRQKGIRWLCLHNSVISRRLLSPLGSLWGRDCLLLSCQTGQYHVFPFMCLKSFLGYSWQSEFSLPSIISVVVASVLKLWGRGSVDKALAG